MESSVTVAVFDGNSGTRQGLIHRLQQVRGIAVVGQAQDSCAALAVIRERQPDVVVMDLRGLTPNAAEFLEQLTAAAPEAGIVVLTAYLTECERADLTRAGARAIVLKEIDSDALVRTIRTVARRGDAQDRCGESRETSHTGSNKEAVEQ